MNKDEDSYQWHDFIKCAWRWHSGVITTESLHLCVLQHTQSRLMDGSQFGIQVQDSHAKLRQVHQHRHRQLTQLTSQRSQHQLFTHHAARQVSCTHNAKLFHGGSSASIESPLVAICIEYCRKISDQTINHLSPI